MVRYIVVFLILTLVLTLIYGLVVNTQASSSVITTSGSDYSTILNLRYSSGAFSGGYGRPYPPQPPVTWVNEKPDYLTQWVLKEWNKGGEGTSYLPAPPVSYVSEPPDYLIQYVLTPWNKGGYGRSYPPQPPVSYVSERPDYLIQYILKEWNEGGIGKVYPPQPPVSWVSEEPDYLVQWVLKAVSNNSLIKLNLSVNTTETSPGKYVNATLSCVGGALPISGTAELYVNLNNGELVNIIKVDLVNGYGSVLIRFNESGTYLLYAIMSSVKSNVVKVKVGKLGTSIRLELPNESVKVLSKIEIRPHLMCGSSEVMGEPIKVYISYDNHTWSYVSTVKSGSSTYVKVKKYGNGYLYVKAEYLGSKYYKPSVTYGKVKLELRRASITELSISSTSIGNLMVKAKLESNGVLVNGTLVINVLKGGSKLCSKEVSVSEGRALASVSTGGVGAYELDITFTDGHKVFSDLRTKVYVVMTIDGITYWWVGE